MMVYYRILNIFPCDLQQDSLLCPVCIYQFATVHHKLPLHPSPAPVSPLATACLNLFLFCKQVHLCRMVDSTCK